MDGKIVAATAVAKKLHEAEDAVDAAIEQIALLSAELPRARRTAGVSALFGQRAVTQIAEAVALAAQMRTALTNAHQSLTVTGKQMGLGPLAFGDVTRKPKSAMIAEPALEAVA